MEITPDFRYKWEEWKKQHPHLSDKELLEALQKDEDLLKSLQVKTGKTRKEIFNWLHLMG